MRIIISNTSSDTIITMAAKDSWVNNYKYNKLYLNTFSMMSLFEEKNLALLKIMTSNSKSLTLVNTDTTSDIYDTMLLEKGCSHYIPFIKVDTLEKLLKRLSTSKHEKLDNIDILMPSPDTDSELERLGKLLNDYSRLITSIDYRTGELSPHITETEVREVESTLITIFKKFYDSKRFYLTFRD